MNRSKFIRECERVLNQTGKEFEIIEKRKHYQIVFVGEVIITVSTDNGQRERDTKALQSAIRRRLRELGEL